MRRLRRLRSLALSLDFEANDARGRSVVTGRSLVHAPHLPAPPADAAELLLETPGARQLGHAARDLAPSVLRAVVALELKLDATAGSSDHLAGDHAPLGAGAVGFRPSGR